MAISNVAVALAKKVKTKGKGRKGAGMAAASAGVDAKTYKPVKLATSRRAQVKAMTAGLEATNTILPYPLCIYPMHPLAATLAICRATMNS